MQNTISVDVEEYFHATNLEPWVGPRHWHQMPSRLEITVARTLELFAEAKVTSTFFVLGSVARRWPNVIRSITAAGHEIASHGYGHRLAYTQNEAAFFRDIYRTKRLLEDISGSRVDGYRAPNFSIRESNRWAYEKLIEAGYRYDSSLFPIRHHRYGNRHQPRTPFLVRTDDDDILIIPLATRAVSCFGHELRFPIAGGAYWRFLPLALVKRALSAVNSSEQLAFHAYFHPWELDTFRANILGVPWQIRLRHYGGTRRMPEIVSQVLHQFHFGPMRDVAESCRKELRRSNQCQSK